MTSPANVERRACVDCEGVVWVPPTMDEPRCVGCALARADAPEGEP